MKEFTCYSDVRSVTVGSKEFRVDLPNRGGDGTTMCYIFEDEGEFALNKDHSNSSFVTCVEGTFNVYNYDCTSGIDEDILITLTGRYGVYRSNMKVILVKWE